MQTRQAGNQHFELLFLYDQIAAQLGDVGGEGRVRLGCCRLRGGLRRAAGVLGGGLRGLLLRGGVLGGLRFELGEGA